MIMNRIRGGGLRCILFFAIFCINCIPNPIFNPILLIVWFCYPAVLMEQKVVSYETSPDISEDIFSKLPIKLLVNKIDPVVLKEHLECESAEVNQYSFLKQYYIMCIKCSLSAERLEVS